MANPQDPAPQGPQNPYDHSEGAEDTSKFKSRPAKGARRLTPEEAARLIPGLADVGSFQDLAIGPMKAAPELRAADASDSAEAELETQEQAQVAAEAGAERISAAFESALADSDLAPLGADSEAAEREFDQAFDTLANPPESELYAALPARRPRRMLWAAGVGAILLGAGLAVVLPKKDTSELEGVAVAKLDKKPAPSSRGDGAKAGVQSGSPSKTSAAATPDRASSQPGPTASAGPLANAEVRSGFSLSGWLGARFDSGGGSPLPVEYGSPMLVLGGEEFQTPSAEGDFGSTLDSTSGLQTSPGSSVGGDLALPQGAAELTLANGETAPQAGAEGSSVGPLTMGSIDPSAGQREAEAMELLTAEGRAQRSATLPVSEQLLMPAPLDNIARAQQSDFAHIFQGRQVTAELLSSDRSLLTPGVGPVRVRLTNGEYFDGQLREAGARHLVLATVHGALTLDLGKVEGVDHLDPDKPLVATAAPREGAELVRVRTKGGVIAGRVLVRDEHRVTIKLADGGELTLRDPEYLDGGVEASSVALVGLRPPQ